MHAHELLVARRDHRLQHVVGGHTIKLRAGHYKLTIPGTREHDAATGDLNITNHVTIDGAGASITTIDGNHIDRVFETFGGPS